MNKKYKLIMAYVVPVLLIVVTLLIFKMNYAVITLQTQNIPFKKYTRTAYVVRKGDHYTLPTKNLFENDDEILFKGWKVEGEVNLMSEFVVSRSCVVEAVFKEVESVEALTYEMIPFKTIYEDSKIPKAQQQNVLVEGQNGIMEIRTRIIYHDDVVYKKERPSKYVKLAPVDEIRGLKPRDSRQE